MNLHYPNLSYFNGKPPRTTKQIIYVTFFYCTPKFCRINRSRGSIFRDILRNHPLPCKIGLLLHPSDKFIYRWPPKPCSFQVISSHLVHRLWLQALKALSDSICWGISGNISPCTALSRNCVRPNRLLPCLSTCVYFNIFNQPKAPYTILIAQ